MRGGPIPLSALRQSVLVPCVGRSSRYTGRARDNSGLPVESHTMEAPPICGVVVGRGRPLCPAGLVLRMWVRGDGDPVEVLLWRAAVLQLDRWLSLAAQGHGVGKIRGELGLSSLGPGAVEWLDRWQGFAAHGHGWVRSGGNWGWVDGARSCRGSKGEP